MLRNNHSGVFLILALFLTGCNNHKEKKQETFDLQDELSKDLERPKESPLEEHRAPVSKIHQIWYTKVDLVLTKGAPVPEMIKNIANKLGLRIVFSLKETPGVNYVAKQKPFLEILSDLAEIYGWKIKINALNAKIAPDSPYLQIYSVPFLIGTRTNTSDTSFSGKIKQGGMTTDGVELGGVNLGSSAQLSSNVQLDVFSELKKNIEILFPEKEGEDVVKFSVHQQGGLLSVIASQKNHRMLAKYISTLSKQISNQILIEARIYEIELLEKYETGVDWARIMSYPLLRSGAPIRSSGVNGFSFEFVGNPTNALNEISGTIAHFLREFGKVNSVSNPRVLIANNNTGIFKAVENKVFFKIKKEENFYNIGGKQNGQVSTARYYSEIQTVPIGTIILVQPSICEDGRITIALRPTITEVHGVAVDPAFDLEAKKAKVDARSEVPIVKTRELDTIFTTEEGRVIVIGGLLYSNKTDKEEGLPLSWLGTNKLKFSQKKEVVIVIRATKETFNFNCDDSIYLE